MLYLIGLGLNASGISKQGLDAIKKCKKIYLEDYTINFPYPIKELEKIIKRKTIPVNRKLVESDKLIREAKKENIALLVYGSLLTATTHISLIQEAKKQKIKYEIIYNASIVDAIAETGLQLYKLGKITSMPKWNRKKNFMPESFIDVIKKNNSIKAHSLILIDMDLEFSDALKQLDIVAKKHNVKLKKIIICSRLGTKEKKIFYDDIENLKKINVKTPYCLIIPGKLHFMEKEILESYKL